MSKEEIITEYEAQKQKAEQAQRAEALDHPESCFSRMQTAARRPIYNVLLAGALVASPLVVGGIWATRKAADKVIGNLPVVSVPYKMATGAIDKVGSVALDTAAFAVSTPAIIPDRLEDVHEVLTNTVRTESKGRIGKTMEAVTETSVGAVKKTAEALIFTVKKAFEGIGWSVNTLTEPVRMVIKGYAKALVGKPIPTLLGTALVAGGIYSMGALPAAKGVFEATLAILQGVAKWLGVPVPIPVPVP